MHGKGYIARFEENGIQQRGLLGHVCGRNNFGVAYTEAERLFDIAQRSEETVAALERFETRAARILPELETALPHLSWQQSVRDAISASSWQVMREATNAVRSQHGRIQGGGQTLAKVAGRDFWIDYRAMRRAWELKHDIGRFRDYLANDARQKDLSHRVNLMADIEHRWSITALGMADADLALRPGNLDKLFRAVNTLRLLHPEPWDEYDPLLRLEEWKLQVRIRGTVLERVPKLEEGKGLGWIVETDLATGSHP